MVILEIAVLYMIMAEAKDIGHGHGRIKHVHIGQGRIVH